MNVIFILKNREWVFNSYIPDNILQNEIAYLTKHDTQYKVFKVDKFDLEKVDELRDTLNK